MAAGLAYYLALKIAGGAERLPVLKQQYDDAWAMIPTPPVVVEPINVPVRPADAPVAGEGE